MKRLISILFLTAGLVACDNFEIDHPDFDYTSGFFPYQFPVRTLVLGDYIYDNANDNAHKFVISAAMGGVYENDRNRAFTIEVDNSLCNDIWFTAAGPQIEAMPANYYTLSSATQLVIPAGKMNGGVEVQLSDAFFSDPKAITLGYVVPLQLKSSNDVDTILTGSSPNPAADQRIASQWNVAPKNFTMFAVKYVNEFHGTYFQYGASQVKDASNAAVESTTYSEKYVENNQTVRLATSARYQVSTSINLKSAVMTGSVGLLLTFNGNACTVSAPAGSAYTISGTGTFKPKTWEWGNKKRDGIELTYTISKDGNTYTATDVLVIRDRGIVMETYSPTLQAAG
ncbi:MAG: DUF5627 domain-containing protein [Prolixibacteraceae bacterium]